MNGTDKRGIRLKLGVMNRNKITPLAWSPLAQGKLGSDYPVRLQKPNHTKEQAIRDILNQIAKEKQCSRTNVALAWLLRHPANIIPIIGSTNPEHIQDAVKATDLLLTREDWYLLTTAAATEPLP